MYQRYAKSGTTTITNLLYDHAVTNSKCIKCITAFVIPQPIQCILNNNCDIHKLKPSSKKLEGRNNKIIGRAINMSR